MSTDRYGDETPAVVDFDSRRRVREAQTAIQRAREQRERLADTRTVHAPMSSDQADATRRHRRAVTDRAEAQRNKIRIANCQLCDDDGYTPRTRRLRSPRPPTRSPTGHGSRTSRHGMAQHPNTHGCPRKPARRRMSAEELAAWRRRRRYQRSAWKARR